MPAGYGSGAAAAAASGKSSGSATWAGAGLTRTAASSTLFCAPLPPTVPLEAVRALFTPMLDFIALRAVRSMLFIDFASEAAALAAMRRHQGALANPALKFPGIQLDFDKDARQKRNSAYEAVQRGAVRDEVLFCVLCHFPSLYLAGGTRLEALPRRATDGAAVVDEAAALRQLACAAGEAALLRREGGRVERQVPLCCRQCGVRWGYRPEPLGKECRYLYIHDKALTHSLRGGSEGHALREEVKGALKRRREGEGEARAGGGAEGCAGGGGGGGSSEAQASGEGAAAAATAAAASGGAGGEAAEPGGALRGAEGEGGGSTAGAAEAAGAEGAGAAAALGGAAVEAGAGALEADGGEGQPTEGAGSEAAAADSAFSSDALRGRFERFLAKAKERGGAPTE